MSHGHSIPKILDTKEQASLPKLPVPNLEDTCRRYLSALKELQDADEHADTKRAVDEFLHGDGPRIQQKLQAWAETQARSVLGFVTNPKLTKIIILAISRSSG